MAGPGGGDVRGRPRHARPVLPATRSQRVAVAVLVLVGFAVLLYPTVAQHLSARRQADVVQGYAESIAARSDADLAAELERARQYNAALPRVRVQDPYTTGTLPGTDSERAELERYESLLAGETMARLRVPAIGMDLPVEHGTGADTLERGAGHLYGTSLPVGGPSTHASLTSHRGFPEATLFSNLDLLAVGDVMLVDVLGETLTYVVDQVLVVTPDDTAALDVVEGEDHLTLVTCTPYGVNSHRLLVRGTRAVTSVEDAAPAVSTAKVPLMTGPPWSLLVGVLAVSLAGVAARARRSR